MSRGFIDIVGDYIRSHGLIEDEASVLVGVSGGVDSMVCLTVLRRLGYEVEALHVNYNLREGAEGDEAHVRDWCEERALPLQVVHRDAEKRAEREDESLQEAARILRYDAMAERATQIGAEAVAVGHHRDDQAETLLLNLLRGAGPEGLAAMPPCRPMEAAPSVDLVRPLLAVSRSDIEAFATAEGISWREDPTNQDPSYDRAVLRTEVLPLLQKRFPGAAQNLARAARLTREYVESSLRPELERYWDRCYEDCPVGGRLALEGVHDLEPVWRRRLILEALRKICPGAPQSAAVARKIDELVEAQVGRRVEVGDATVWRERDGLRFVPVDPNPKGEDGPWPVPLGEDVKLPGGRFQIEVMETPPDTLDSGSATIEYVDADALTQPLRLRPWHPGDRFQPLGMDGTKPVSTFLTDEKVPAHRRSEIYLLTAGGQVIWVVGHRLDHTVRVLPETNRVARLSWQPRENTSDDCNST